MNSFRNNLSQIGDFKVLNVKDYSLGIEGLPKSNVLKIYLENDTALVVRPSGTEPKLKIYISIKGNSIKSNDELRDRLMNEINRFMEN